MRSGSTRDALVSAALRVVEAEGLPAATTRRVAAEAGLPLGTVHYWFADKRQLVAAVTDALLHEVRERAAGASDLRDAHHRLSQMTAGRQLALVELTTAALRDPSLHDLARQQYAAYRAAALQQVGGGPEALATLVVAVLDGLTLSTLAEDADGRGRARADAAVELLLHLLEGRGEGQVEGQVEEHRDRVAPPGDAS